MRIDSHQHFWQYDPNRHSWINDQMKVLKRDFLPNDLSLLLSKNHLDGCVAVQADQSEGETDYLLGLAAENRFIKGVIGWVDFQSDPSESLERYAANAKCKGFRHVVQDEQDDRFILSSRFVRGISKLDPKRFTYDILIFEHQLPATVEFAGMFPNLKLVVDHIAKPRIREKSFDSWAKHMTAIAELENVCCKISGMVTEAKWNNWSYDQLVPYLEHVLEAFGPNRLMFGSDWPVCLLAADYDRVVSIVTDFISTLSHDEQHRIMGGTAVGFYQLAV